MSPRQVSHGKPTTRLDRVGHSLCLPGRPLMGRVDEHISSWHWQQFQPQRQHKEQNSDCFRVQQKAANGSDLELRAMTMKEDPVQTESKWINGHRWQLQASARLPWYGLTHTQDCAGSCICETWAWPNLQWPRWPTLSQLNIWTWHKHYFLELECDGKHW